MRKALTPHITTFPAGYLVTGELPELIVVGSVDDLGDKSPFSQGIDDAGEVTTYALGQDVICAAGDGAASMTGTGTSFGKSFHINQG